jgi:Asp-tRNA(Asn)/Glu-tRNA(Gln) amidotransferase A subunit family amidase
MIEVTEVSIAELRDALESGRTTAVELVKAYLAHRRLRWRRHGHRPERRGGAQP